jgi:hypothetical protein
MIQEQQCASVEERLLTVCSATGSVRVLCASVSERGNDKIRYRIEVRIDHKL